MATTTNYGWTTPDDTALVKDGASAIRTLGSSVDTTTKNLNPETTLGDIAYRSSTANVKTRLGLGTAGQVLTVNSGANAPEWTTISAGSMTLLATTTLSGASTVVSSINQTYNSLMLIGTGITYSTSTSFRIRPNSIDSLFKTTGTADGAAGSQDDCAPYNTGAAASNSSNGFCMIINNYISTNYKPVIWYGSHSATNVSMAGVSAHTAAITSLQYTTNNGATLGGTIYLYGVK
jgi:hypothetical protein